MQLQVPSDYLLYGFESQGNVIIPPHYQPKRFSGDTLLWLLPKDPEQGQALKLTCGHYAVNNGHVNFIGSYTQTEFPARPACDFFGKRIKLEIAHGEMFEQAYARFYWDNLLPQIAERTMMRNKPDIRDGYVLSTLNKKAYAGTYPAVDHEFHMKGRFAVGGAAEASLIRRMLELQLKVMREDKTESSKNLCAIQPNRAREYDVWRKSRNGKHRAQMFRITANVEFVEGMYNYYCLTKDINFLHMHIHATERNCTYIESFIRPDGLLDSHVYYEDQVIKHGPVAQAQCFAVHAFRLMAKLESLLGRTKQAAHYAELAETMGEAVQLFWSHENERFVDWIDGNGQVHDHIHLLANQLPTMLSLATNEQAAKCAETIATHSEIWAKFPSFVAANIENYTEGEIGTGGPYDLCAAGRYWCWDAEFLAWQNNGDALLCQLLQVAEQAKHDHFLMGERYDMNYVYYQDDKNWHGASLYYEYPNVFLYVLVCQYLGVRRGFDCDLVLKPQFAQGTVTLESYGISYTLESDRLTLQNTSRLPLTIDLPNLGKRVTLRPGETNTL